MKSKIQIENTNEMIEITAKLLREGICFEVKKVDGLWLINLTGGY